MYPAGELSLLATRKALLRVRIAERRGECVAAGARLAQPFGLVDRGLALWRSIPPFAKALAVPALLLLMRKFSGRGGILGSVARMAPTIFSVARTMAGRG